MFPSLWNIAWTIFDMEMKTDSKEKCPSIIWSELSHVMANMCVSINEWLQWRNDIQHGARNNFELKINWHTDKQLFAYLLLICCYFRRETDDVHIYVFYRTTGYSM